MICKYEKNKGMCVGGHSHHKMRYTKLKILVI